jgi:hypothetical protein
MQSRQYFWIFLNGVLPHNLRMRVIFFTIIFTAFGWAKTNTADDAETFLTDAIHQHEELINDPLLKRGEISKFLSKKEFNGFSDEDLNLIRRTIVKGSFQRPIKFSRDKTVISLTDPKFKSPNGTPSKIDFREITALPHGVIYINGLRYELKYVVPRYGDEPTQIKKQLEDLKSFLTDKKLADSFPGLAPNLRKYAGAFLQILFAPLALSGCEEPEDIGGGAVSFSSVFAKMGWCFRHISSQNEPENRKIYDDNCRGKEEFDSSDILNH